MSSLVIQLKSTLTAKKLMKYIAIILALFLVVNFNIHPFSMMLSRIMVQYLIILLILIKYPLSKGKNDSPLIKFIDYALIISVVITAIFFYFKLYEFIAYTGVGTPLYQMIMATFSVLIIFEATRRVTGPILPILALTFFVYAIYSGHRYMRIITEIYSWNGVFGSAFSLAISIIFIFLLFGNILNAANFGNFLIKFGTTLVGGMSGGPAKIAVVSSSLFGSISGSAVTNVVSTGTFTIPLMKKLGFAPHIAGGVEASASVGGSIMPPIMAAAAFLMAEILQIPYLHVAKAALLPALAYYVCVFTSVDSYSKRLGLRGIPKSERPTLRESMSEGGHLLLVLIFLIHFLINRIYPLRAAYYTILILFPLAFVNKKTRLTLNRTADALSKSVDGLLVVGAITATCGSVIACIGLTGVGGQIASNIIKIAGGNMLFVMFLVMILCIMFSMSLPTTAAYLVLVPIVAPSLIKLGVVPIAAHLFVLYFCALSGITPPVAVASFAAASIAHARLMKTAISGLKFSFVAFIVPYIFVYYPSMVFEAEHLNMLFVIILFIIVLPISFAWGLWGHSFFEKLSIFERSLNILVAILIVLFSITGLFKNNTIWGYIISFVWAVPIAYRFIIKKTKSA